MVASIVELQRKALLDAIHSPKWRNAQNGPDPNATRIIVLDDHAAKLLALVSNQDEIMREPSIIDVKHIDADRSPWSTDYATYILSPQTYAVEQLRIDLNEKRHRGASLIWVSHPPNELCEMLYKARSGQELLRGATTLSTDFFASEPQLVLFRDPDSFQICFNKSCESRLTRHLQQLAQKIVAVCLSLGECPTVRFYSPPDPLHRAAVLSRVLAERVQNNLDQASQALQIPKSKGVLIITDRSMDPMAPLVHATTYQAMAADLLPSEEVHNRMYSMDVKALLGEPSEQEQADHENSGPGQRDRGKKVVGLSEQDKFWVENRHLSFEIVSQKMKDVLAQVKKQEAGMRLGEPGANSSRQINQLKDIFANMPGFMEMKETITIHINLIAEIDKLVVQQKLWDSNEDEENRIFLFEQSLSTGLDDYSQRPKGLAILLARFLDAEGGGFTVPEIRIRLLIMYILYRGGILRGDIEKLSQHARLLSEKDRQTISNFAYLGVQVEKALRGQQGQPQNPGQEVKERSWSPFDPLKTELVSSKEGNRAEFHPGVRYLLEGLCNGTLDARTFPHVKPEDNMDASQPSASQSSLRTGNKPVSTWARQPGARKPKQRIIVYMAGGATYSESQECQQVSQRYPDKDVFLIAPEMLTPNTFLDKVAKLNLREEQVLSVFREKPRPPPISKQMSAPQGPPHSQQQQQQQQQRPVKNGPSSQAPVESMQRMNLGPPQPQNGQRPSSSSQVPTPPSTAGSSNTTSSKPPKEGKEKDKDKDKKRKLFGLGRKH